MKFAIAAILLATTTSAFACPHSPDQFICPGDTVVDRYDRLATVTAVNPFKKTVSYRLGDNSIDSEAISDLALGIGCLEAVCVGDVIVDRYDRQARAVAVNPYTRQVAYRLGDNSIDNESLEDVMVGYGCTLGYCVGDGITDRYERMAVIVALSPYNDTAAYRLGDNSIDNEAITDLSNTNFCADYGDEVRKPHRYPGLPSMKYATPVFHYYSSRK